MEAKCRFILQSRFCVHIAEELVQMIQITLKLAQPAMDKDMWLEDNKSLQDTISNSNKHAINVEVKVKHSLQSVMSAEGQR